MIKENNANYQLAYITGNNRLTNGHNQNWIAGWIEENKHPYFFVLNTEGKEESNSDSLQSRIVRPILKELGFFEGKK